MMQARARWPACCSCLALLVCRVLTVVQLEIAELQRQEIDIRQEKEDKEREVADALAPRLASLELAGIPAIYTRDFPFNFTASISYHT
jgi:hypothetical protein